MCISGFNFYDDDVNTKQSATLLMKIKKISLIITAVTLSLATTPLVAKAQSEIKIPQVKPIQVAQIPTEVPPRLQKLNLTDNQKSQIIEVVQQGRQEIQDILTPKQQQKFKRAIANGREKRQALRSLNLSNDQKREVKAVIQSQRSEIESILTDEQKEDLQELKSNFPRGARLFNR